LDCATNQSIAFGFLLQLLVWGCQDPLLFSGVSSISTKDAKGPGHCGSGIFIAEGVDGVGNKESADTTMSHVDTLLDAFLKDFQTWDYIHELLKHQSFWSTSIQIEKVLLFARYSGILQGKK
jgi:hypothetical protein